MPIAREVSPKAEVSVTTPSTRYFSTVIKELLIAAGVG
jgi:hypothetical protein